MYGQVNSEYMYVYIVVYNAGETPADGRSYYVVNSTMAELAKNLNGIVIVMEHRFYGKSMPGPVSNVIRHAYHKMLIGNTDIFCRLPEYLEHQASLGGHCLLYH